MEQWPELVPRWNPARLRDAEVRSVPRPARVINHEPKGSQIVQTKELCKTAAGGDSGGFRRQRSGVSDRHRSSRSSGVHSSTENTKVDANRHLLADRDVCEVWMRRVQEVIAFVRNQRARNLEDGRRRSPNP